MQITEEKKSEDPTIGFIIKISSRQLFTIKKMKPFI